MALPFLLPAVLGLTRMLGRPAMSQAVGGAPIMGAVGGALGGRRRGPGRRRRRALLTRRELADLSLIKDIIGKTAAAEALKLLRMR